MKPPVAHTTKRGLIFSIGWVAVHTKQVMSHLCVLWCNVSRALHTYVLAIAASINQSPQHVVGTFSCQKWNLH